MSITTLTKQIGRLQRAAARRTQDRIDRALCIVEIEIDTVHSGTPFGEDSPTPASPTRDQLEKWFVDFADISVDEIHAHRAYIREHLDFLASFQ